MKTMKKLCLCILALMLVSVAVFGLTACDKKEATECVHDWGELEIITPSTCVEAGKARRVCKLDPTHVEDITLDLAPHTFTEYESNNDATCSRDGTKVAYCDVEGCEEKHIAVDFDSILDHNFNKQVATEEYLKTPADCDTKATYYKSCECGAKGTATFTVGDYQHNFSDELSYDDEGHWYACECGERSGVANHEWDEGTVIKEANCYETGVLHKTCVCGAEENELIPIVHSLDHTSRKNATCEAVGNIEYWHCSICDKYFSDDKAETEITRESTVIAVIPHDFANGVWTYTASSHTKKCANCDATDSASATAHTLVPTSTVQQHWYGCECGYKEQIENHGLSLKYNNECHWFECSCGFKSVEYNHEEAKGATPVDSKASSCTEDGYEAHRCATCNVEFKKTIPAAHSTLKHFDASAATCDTQGNIEYWQCELCKKYYLDANATTEILLKDIPTAALGHDFENGKIRRDDTHHYTECSRCGAIDEQNKAAHTYTRAYDDESHYKICTVCDHKTNVVLHNWRVATIQAPTCQVEGTGIYTCSCGHSKEGSIPVISHDLVIVNAKASTCTEYGNIAHWKCSSCGKLFQFDNASIEITLESTLTPMHDFENGIYTYTADKHAKICANCNAVSEYVAHGFTTDAYNSERHWQECVCGCRTNDYVHVFTSEIVDGFYHKISCSCGYAEIEEHAYVAFSTNGSEHDHLCDCGYIESAIPGGLTVTSTDTEHYGECGCGYTTAVEPHEFTVVLIDENTHRHICDCGFASDVITGSVTENCDDESHWSECACGYETVKTAHTLTLKYEDLASHWHECDVCDYKSDVIDTEVTFGGDNNVHFASCECGLSAESAAHEYENKTNSTHHWSECKICGKKINVEAHAFKAVSIDAAHHAHECECGYKSATLPAGLTVEYDSNGHWHKCSCGYVTDTEAHSFKGAANETEHWAVCDCGYTNGYGIHLFKAAYLSDTQHTHVCTCGYVSAAVDGALTVKSNDYGHWYECSCNYTTDTEAHSFKGAANETEHWAVCDCGYTNGYGIHLFKAAYLSDTQHTHVCTCGYVSAAVDGALTLESDEFSHWYECSCGYKTDATPHSFEIKKLDAEKHYEECACGYSKTAVEHVYIPIYVSDTEHLHSCICGHETAPITGAITTANDGSQHWKECGCGHKTNFASHSYTPGNDATHHWLECACGHKSGVTTHTLNVNYNGSEHWLECACGYTEGNTSHTLSVSHNDINHWQECSCGYTGAFEQHSLSGNCNTTEHWAECSCGYKNGFGIHIYSVVYDINGHWSLCACGYTANHEAHSFTEKSDDANHWLECSCGCIVDVEEHVFDVKHDDTGHWLECECTYKKDNAPHNTDYAYDNDGHWLECECGYELTEEDHVFVTNYDDRNHWLECACGYVKNTEVHTVSGTFVYNSTTDKFEHWHVCSCGYESDPVEAEVIDPDSTADNNTHWLKVSYDENSHWLECIFEAKAIIEAHSFTPGYDADGHYLECICGYRKNVETHDFEVFNNASQHWGICYDCGYQTSAVNHDYTIELIDDTEHKCTCSCGYEYTEIHDVTPTYFNENSHTLACKCGYVTAREEHSFDTGYDAAQHWQECDCGYKIEAANHNLEAKKDSDNHWDDCGAMLNYQSHSLKPVALNEENHIHECECGYKSAAKSGALTKEYNDYGHWFVCSCNYTTDTTEHEFDAMYNADVHWAKCSECDYVGAPEHHVLAPAYDDESHWNACECGYRETASLPHDFETKFNANEHFDECKDCGYKKNIATHTYKLITDEFGHSFVCPCGAVDVPYTLHTWDDGVITKPATCKSNGEKTYTCECGATRIEVIYASVSATHATLKYVPGYAARCTKPGRIDTWYCPDCHQYFADANATMPVAIEDTYTYVDHDFEGGNWILNTNGKSHAKECANCGIASSYTNHVIKTYYYDETSHYVGCECGYISDGGIVAHTFEYAYDGNYHYFSCTECSYKSYEEHDLVCKSNDTHHWYECACGYKSPEAIHAYAPTYDDTIHYDECVCGHSINAANHKLVYTISPNGHRIECSDCDYATETLDHEFELKFNDTEHWHECVCGLTAAHGNHYMNTVSDDDYYWTECAECEFKTAPVGKQ